MLEERFVISDRQWVLMEPHCLGKKTDPGRTRPSSSVRPDGINSVVGHGEFGGAASTLSDGAARRGGIVQAV